MIGVKHNHAISAALTLAATPSLLRVMRQHPVPDDVVELLYIFAGDELALRHALSWSGTHRLQLMASIENYVQQVMAFDGAHAGRVLGVSSVRDRDQALLHLKLLMQGLHPDQSGDPWRKTYAARVISAWKDLSGDDEMPVAVSGMRLRQAVAPRFHVASQHRPFQVGALRRLVGKFLFVMGVRRRRRPL